jgi:hypothetical protein
MKNRIYPLLFSFVDKHYPKILFAERISMVVLIIGVLIYHFEHANYSFLIVPGSILAAIAYFISSYRHIETENFETTGILNSVGFINFIYKLTFYSLVIGSLALLGLVFNIKKFNPYIFSAGFTLISTLIISLITKINDRTIIYNSAFYLRILIMLILLSYLLLVNYNKI